MKAVAIALRTDFEQPLSGLDQAVRSDESVHDEPRELFVLFFFPASLHYRNFARSE